MTFQVDPMSKHNAMMCMSTAFRPFRYNLNKKYVQPFLDQPERLRTPPVKYTAITQKQWDQFVDIKLSENFKVTIFL